MTEPENLTDEQIAVLVQKGDKEKFGVLMDRYKRKLVRYGSKFLANPDSVEDAVQETFVKAYRNLLDFNPERKFSSWVYRIAHNEFINSIRKISRGPLYLFDFDTLISHTEFDDPIQKEKEWLVLKDIVDQGLKDLPPKYREIMVLYYLEELDYKQISDVLSIPVGTVGVRLKRAKEMLKKKISTQTIL